MLKFINEVNILIGSKMIKNHTRYTKKLEIKPEKTSKNLNIEREYMFFKLKTNKEKINKFNFRGIIMVDKLHSKS